MTKTAKKSPSKPTVEEVKLEALEVAVGEYARLKDMEKEAKKSSEFRDEIFEYANSDVRENGLLESIIVLVTADKGDELHARGKALLLNPSYLIDGIEQLDSSDDTTDYRVYMTENPQLKKWSYESTIHGVRVGRTISEAKDVFLCDAFYEEHNAEALKILTLTETTVYRPGKEPEHSHRLSLDEDALAEMMGADKDGSFASLIADYIVPGRPTAKASPIVKLKGGE